MNFVHAMAPRPRRRSMFAVGILIPALGLAGYLTPAALAQRRTADTQGWAWRYAN
jgi:hypothetical protein